MDNKLNNLREFDKFQIDLEKKILWFEEKRVELSPKAVELLCVLIQNEGEVVSKDDLLEQVWHDSFVEESVLSQNVYLLRKTFKKFGLEDDLIKTVPRRGYYFSKKIENAVDEHITIRHEKVERQIVAGAFLEENEISEGIKNVAVIVPQNKTSKTELAQIQTDQIPAASSLKRGWLFYLPLTVLVLSVIGAGIWFWGGISSNRTSVFNNYNAGLVKYSRLTDSGKAQFPMVSPDSQQLAYVLNEGEKYKIVLQHMATGSETVVTESKDGRYRSINFSPDGNYLYYADRSEAESTIYQIPIFGGTKRKIVTNVRQNFSISPDGKYFAFFRYEAENDVTHLMTSRIDGSDEKIIATREVPKFFRVWGTFPSWSPDGQKLLVSAKTELSGKKEGEKQFYLLEIDIASGEEKLIKTPDWHSPLQAFWIEDGSGFLVSVREKVGKPRQLWYLSYSNGEAVRLTNDTNHYRDFRLSPDGRFVVAVDQRSIFNLSVAPVETPEQIRQLTFETSKVQGGRGLEWTKDGKSLIYVKGDDFSGGDLWKINLETSETQQLTFDEKAEHSYLRETPDGKSVIFGSNRDGNWHIWQIDLDGRNLRRITNGSGENYPEISPDGKWLYYCTPGGSPKELWRIPLAGGEPERVLPGAVGVNLVSPKDPDKLVAYYFDSFEKNKHPWKFVLFSTENVNKKETLGFLTQDHVIDWKNDGSGIYFLSRGETNNNVRFYSIKDKSTRPVTFFKEQRIVNLRVSPNGKNFALSRGTRSANILKIDGFRKD